MRLPARALASANDTFRRVACQHGETYAVGAASDARTVCVGIEGM
jgi:hypothetical protein